MLLKFANVNETFICTIVLVEFGTLRIELLNVAYVMNLINICSINVLTVSNNTHNNSGE